MSNENAIPQTYEQWRYCIEVLGRIELTPDYISKRLSVLEDESNIKRKKFSELYGETHLQNIVTWFHRASKESS